ncbi:hypothetical protein GL2_39720 [Microbulbifer sp. GL-2]|nr:hypothetical protein GL2_39720 [Microbulbifer sp. GL-2]
MVFQYYELDGIKNDYYGFQSEGLTYKISLEECGRKFWCEVDCPSFIPNLANYLPELKSSDNLLESSREKLFFYQLMQMSNCSGISCADALKEYQLFRGIFFLKESFLYSHNIKWLEEYNDYWTVSTLNTYFDDRIAELSEAYRIVNVKRCWSVLHFWLISKKIEWTGYFPHINLLSELLQFALDHNKCEKTKIWLEKKIFDLIMRYGDVDILDQFLAKASSFSIRRASINRKVAYLRFITKKSAQSSALADFFNPDDDSSLSSLERLKLEVQADWGRETPQNYKQIESRYLKALPELSVEYEKYVIKVFDQFGDRARYIDVAKDNSQADNFLSLIKENLIKGRGFSFIRLSDGEGYIFREFSDFFKKEDAKNRERHWWGQHIPDAISTGLVSSGISAVKQADILGVPTIYRFLRDSENSKKTLVGTIQGRGLLSVLAGVKKIDNGKTLYTDDKTNLAIFNQLEVVRQLGRLANKVVIVSSGDPEVLKRKIGGDIECIVVNIPTHHKTINNEKYIRSELALPYVYQEISLTLKRVVCKGDLVLVGAGVAGKSFVNIAKRSSAVGLDMGSAMDEFLEAGIHSLY